MSKIIITKGLPGSGKTYWSKEYLKAHPETVRVNKDDLRLMLNDGKWSHGNEKFVLNIRDIIVKTALFLKKDVIVDDTNLNPVHEAVLARIASENGWGEVVIQDFTGVDPEICISRDVHRGEKAVGERVIRKIFNQYLKPARPEVKNDPNMPNCIICDIDGTLALFGDANPYERDFLKDSLNEPVARILDQWEGKTNIILVSGRKDTFKDQTMIWLASKSVPYTKLFMREGDDTRKDVIVKQEIYEVYIKNQYNVLFVLDDRDQVVKFWRDQGLTCLQVAEGDF